MNKISFALAILLLLLPSCAPCDTYTDPPWIFGMHDIGGEKIAEEQGKRIWVLMTEAIGRSPEDKTGPDYQSLTDAGHGVICRINLGYHPTGTIPAPEHYADFAARCANFVRAAKGKCHIWMIGNEMDLESEWPNGQEITPQDYAGCFLMCRKAIRSIPGHEKDWVIPGALTGYGQRAIPWFKEMMKLIGKECDGFALHCYAQGHDPEKIFSDEKCSKGYYLSFRIYRDFMDAIPRDMRDLPVFITETDGHWQDKNNGWIKNACKEIDDWNRSGRQKIRAVCIYRWLTYDSFGISNKPNVIQDWREAMTNDYRWTATDRRSIEPKPADK